MDALLLRVLGNSFSSGEVLQRQSLGSIVHIFSHIRMTLYVEKLVLKVRCLMFMQQYTGVCSALAAIRNMSAL